MHCFIGFLLFFLKALVVIIPVCFLGASSCPGEKKEMEDHHPRWLELNESEEDLPEDKCRVTKLDLGKMRFHIASGQKPIHCNDATFQVKNNMVQTDKADSEAFDWVLTPNFYGRVTSEKFPETIKCGMKHRVNHDDKEGGLPKEFLDECCAIDPIKGDPKEIILIIGKGIEGKLAVSESLQEALKKKKQNNEIQDYEILTTTDAAKRHNKYIKEGKKVYTFIHTAG
ncbi:hypothetical protein ACRRVA_02540 [Candidatus Cardinium hertigii]|uniref:hypothetical protein n=1 Tax=Candidatus Cardinium hertigii TaxID=247481 RepID=UPI003D7EA9AD